MMAGHKDNFQLRSWEDDEEDYYKIDQGLVDPTTAKDYPSLGLDDDRLLSLPSGVISLLLGADTREYHEPTITNGQVIDSLKLALPHWDKKTPGNPRVSQLCAALRVIADYKFIAMWRCPK